jgi:hypothetical protein
MVDLLALDEEALLALVEKGIGYSQKEGTDLLGCILPKGHSYFRMLRRRGFLPSFKSFQLMIYPHGREDVLLDSKGWYLNWGDTDVI